ncbi:DUF481 domain-containing protein [Thiohalorhabdus sp.]|uniref:DUF481 domain-containing protein n=1 Tax=Thiohalorhabdus sp. TaxID=3094134 RepID=UPI002FC36598
MPHYVPHFMVASLLLPLAAAAQDLPDPETEGAAEDKARLWETEAELGLSTSSGNTDTTTTRGRIASDRTGNRFVLHLLAEGRFSQEDSVTTSQRGHGLTQLDYQFQPRTYGFGVVEITHDRFAGYDARLQEAVGLGRFLLQRDTMTWRLEGGPALRQEWRTDDTYESSARARLRTLFDWRFREASGFTQEIIYTPSLEHGDDFLLTSETSLSFRLNARVALKTSVTVEHDSQPLADVERTDTYTSTSLLFHF